MSLVGAFLEIVLPTAYGITGMIAARLLAGHLAWRMHFGERDSDRTRYPNLYPANRPYRALPRGDQWFAAWCFALCVAPVWPLLLFALAPVPHFGWALGAERKGQVEARDRRIEELEREAGIR